jgi:DNA-binding response OmpR family regulator
MNRPSRVIVVDDDPCIGESMSNLLSVEGFAVDVVDCAERAVALCADTHYDAALLGYRLPGMSGLDLLRALRRVDPALRAIVITGNGSGSLVHDALVAGAEAVFHRPLEATSFLPLLLA